MTPQPGGTLLVRRALVPDPDTGPRVVDGRLVARTVVDLRIVDGRIAAVAPSLDHRPGEDELDAGGRAVIPGLHDHHLHLRALAAATRSVAVGPTDVGDAAGMARALGEAPADIHGWRRAVGYHESVAGDLDRHSLDAMLPGAPVRVQHRSGAMWVLSSAALESLGVADLANDGVECDGAGHPTGRLFRLDAWLAARLPAAADPDDLAGLSARLATLGVTGVTDATPGATTEGLAQITAAVDAGRLVQRLHLMCPAGVAVPPHPRLTRGPEKFLLDDDRLPALDSFAAAVGRAHDAGSPVAIHCVTAVQLAYAVAGLETAGVVGGDRIEHAAVVPSGMVSSLSTLAVTVVVNPNFLAERGDTYLEEVDEREHPDLLRATSLRRAGVRLAAGTDAPFGRADPWLAVATAQRRRTRTGLALGPDEALDETAALALFTGRADDPARPRHIAVGGPGDLCILDGDALPAPVADGRVAATVVAGDVVHRLI